MVTTAGLELSIAGFLHQTLPAFCTKSSRTWAGIEYGFSSTTRDHKTAEFYAKVHKPDQASTLIEVHMGSAALLFELEAFA